MKRTARPVLAALVVSGLFGCVDPETADTVRTPEPAPIAAVPVLQVDSVDLRRLEGPPEQFVIVADGTVRSGGWMAPQLIPRHSGQPTADGIFEADFVAVAPSGPATMALAPISAQLDIGALGGRLRGVHIYAETNSKGISLE